MLSCGSDPVHERAVEDLGPEDAAVAPGPLHRPGQPCNVCHGGKGPAKSELALSGTVFAMPSSGEVLPGATVRFIDWVGGQRSTVTNCAGNFFVRAEELTPKWPLWVRVEHAGIVADMQSAIFREGSCNACHTAPATARNAGQVFLSETPFTRAATGCP